MMFPKLIQMAYRRDKLEAEVAKLNRLMVGWKQRATMSETDLEASKAEVALWKAKAHEVEDREGKLEAEVERLTAELHRAAALMAETGREETARRILERAFGTE